MELEDLNNELDKKREEYNNIEKDLAELSEVEFIRKYGSYKIIDFLEQEIEDIEAEIEEKKENSDWRTNGLDEAFSSWYNVESQFV